MKERIDEENRIVIETVKEPTKVITELLNFTRALKGNYPNKDYWGDDAVRRLEHMTGALRAYEAKRGLDTAGMLVGHDSGTGGFWGKFLAVAPKYQHTGIAEKLINAPKSEFDEIHLHASAFGGDKKASHDKKISRQNALLRIYEGMGFESVSSDDFYQEAQQTGAALHMVWRKGNNRV